MSEQTRVVYYPAPEKIYTNEELGEIFARFSVHDPILVALRQVFQARFASAALDAANPRLTEREAGHAGGRIQEIADFREEILGYLGTSQAETEEGKLPRTRKRKKS
jgi:hypothetical protein